MWGRGAVAKLPLATTPDEWIEAEATFTDLVWAVGAPVPRVLGIERIDGRSASIYERIDGRSMWEQMVEEPGDVEALAQSLAALQAHVFSLVPPAGLPAQHDRVASKIRNAADRFDRSLLIALGSVPFVGPARSLCHGDLHPGNVIVGRHGPVIIDWFDVSEGDRTGDVARSALLQSSSAHGPGGPAHLPRSSPQLLERAGRSYLASILALADIDEGTLARWTAVMAVARMSEGVDPRGLRAIWDAWRAGGSLDEAQLPTWTVTSAPARGAP